MSYWQFEGSRNNTPHVGLYGAGSTYDFTMKFVNEEDEALDKVYLFTTTTFDGRIAAKRAEDATYLDIGVLSDPTCSLGTFAVGETEIDFRVQMEAADDGFDYTTIPIYLSHDIGSMQAGYLWFSSYVPLWWDCYDQYEMWRVDYVPVATECSAEYAAGGASFSDAWTDGWSSSWTTGFSSSW